MKIGRAEGAILGATAAIGLSAFWFFIACGIGTSPDSSFYLLISQQMRIELHFSTLGVYAPLYPAILALLTAVGLSTELAIVSVQAASLCSIFLLAIQMSRLVGNSDTRSFLVGLYAVLVAFGCATFQFAWTEVPYAALLMASTVLAAGAVYRNDPALWRFLPIGLMLLLRFIGIFPAALLVAILFRQLHVRHGVTRSAFWRALAGGAIAFGPLLLFALLNAQAWGCALGCRPPSPTGLIENLLATRWTLQLDSPQMYGLLIVLCVPVVTCLRSQREGIRSRMRIASALPLLSVGIAAVSIAGQVYSSTSVKIDPINTRYMCPLYPLLAADFASCTAAVLGCDRRWAARSVSVLALALIGLLALAQDTVTYRESLATNRASMLLTGFGYKQSPMFAAYRQELATIIELPQPGSVVAYAPVIPIGVVTVGYAFYNRGAALVLNSAYYPPGTTCRPQSVESVPMAQDLRVPMLCTTDRGERPLQAAIINDMSQIPLDAGIVIAEKDPAQARSLWDPSRFSLVFETPNHILLRRRVAAAQ